MKQRAGSDIRCCLVPPHGIVLLVIDMGRDYSCCCLLPNPAILIPVLFYTFDNDLDTDIKHMASVNLFPLAWHLNLLLIFKELLT